MENQTFTNVRKLTTSGIVIALYVVILFMTQSFSFGAYQIRIVTSLYALSYLFPFLVIPLGLANFIANMLGGFGIIDMVGVALWLSPMVHMPYGALALSLCIGQTVPAVCGVALSKALEQVFYPKHSISNA